MLTFPLIVIVDPFDVRLPSVAIVSAPAVIPRFEAEVVRMVDPVAPPVEFRTVRVAPIVSEFDAIVYVMLVMTVESRTRLLNSLVPPAKAAKVNVALAASRIVTELVPATQEADVDPLVHVPLTVHVDPPRLTTVVGVRTFTFPVIVIVEFRAKSVPWMLRGPLTVRDQFDPVTVSSVPVNPVMSILAMVVAAASEVVPVGTALKIALSVAAGVHPQAAPPDEFDQLAPVFQAPPAPIR
jgi:hypothetical protein